MKDHPRVPSNDIDIRVDGDVKDFLTCTNFNVICEESNICEAGDFVEAFCVYISTYFCFNVSYADNMMKSLLFAEKAILKLNDDSPKSNKQKNAEKQVIKTIARINEFSANKKKKSKKSK